MKAAMFYGPGQVRFEDVPTPTPGPGEILVRTMVSLTCGTDVKTYRRGHPDFRPPCTFGHEFAGVVEAVGEGVNTFRPGMTVVSHNTAPCGKCYYCRIGRESLCEQRTMIRGAFAEFVLVPSRIVELNVFEVPEAVPLKAAALMEPLSCAVHGVERCGIGLGDWVAINGAGPMGLMLAILCKLKGARVIVCDRSGERLQVARRVAADETIEVTDATDQVQAVRSLTPGGRGVDVAIEAVGLPEVWEKTVLMARPGGTVNLFGGCPPGTSFSVDTKLLHYSEMKLIGVYHTTPRYVKAAFDLICSGAIPYQELITGQFPFPRLMEAIELHAHQKGMKNAIVYG